MSQNNGASILTSKKARIIGLGSYLPERILSNADLEKMVDTSDEWIVTRTGIRERRIARSDEHCSDMAAAAAKEALKNSGKEASEIDMILVATSTPDYLFPSTAALVQQAIGATNASVLDFQAACTGFLYGLSVVQGLIASGNYHNVLLIASEKLSSFIDFEDRATCILFGDGASAALFSDEGAGLAIEKVDLGADGCGADLITLLGGGTRVPASAESVANKQHFIKMEGREVFRHGVRHMVQSSEELLKSLNLTVDDIDWVVPHQANLRIIEAVAKRLEVPMERVYLTVHKYANTSAATVPLALHELSESVGLKEGSRILLTSVGAGLTWGSALLVQEGK